MADAFTSETYNALCRDAEGYLARGLAEQARELLLKATGLIGTRARARSLLADACMQLTLWGEAKSQLEALATLEVDNIYTHFRLGQVLEETSDYELARDNFRVVLDMNPDHHGAKVALSRLEKLSNKSSPSGKTPIAEGQQIFADSDEDNGIFAGDSSESIDELLNTIGMGEKKDIPGVEDLLNSIGMNHEEEKKKEKPSVDFASIFGSSEQDDDSGKESPLSDVFSKGKSEKLTPETSDLSTIFSGSEPAEDTPPPVEEEPEEEVAPAEEAVDLSAMFGDSEPAEDTPAPAEEEPEEEVAPAEEATDLSAMFGDSEPAEDTPPPVEEEPEEEVAPAEDTPPPAEEEPEEEVAPAEEAADTSTKTDLGSIFGGSESEDSKEGLQSSDSLSDPASVFGAGESSEDVVSTGEQPGVAQDADPGAVFGSSEAETVADEEPPAEITVVVPIVSEEVIEDSAEEEDITSDTEKDAVVSTEFSRYTLLPGDGTSLCTLKLENGEVRVIRGLVAAMDGSVSLNGEVLSGNGLVWMGQGNLTPVTVRYKEGMTVRIDRVAARPVQVIHKSCGIGSVPSLCRLNGNGNGNDSNILMFVTGRLKKVMVTPGLRVRNGSVVVADPEVSFTEEESDFLSVSGKGMVIITG